MEQAAIWRNGTFGLLPRLPGGGSFINGARAVNDAGYVAGTAGDNNGLHAVLWDPQGNIKLLGALPGDRPHAITHDLSNNLRYVVGFSSYGGSSTNAHAFMYEYMGWDSPGVFTDLGTLGSNFKSLARAVNDAGIVVGTSFGGSSPAIAFVWDRVRGMRNLNDLIPRDSGWYLSDAEDINESGQIVGTGEKRTGANYETRAFMLIQDDDPPVISCASSDGIWHRDNVRVTCTASDEVGGLADSEDASFRSQQAWRSVSRTPTPRLQPGGSAIEWAIA